MGGLRSQYIFSVACIISMLKNIIKWKPPTSFFSELFTTLTHLPLVPYIYQWAGSALVQVMAWRQQATSHYLNQCWFIVNWTLRNKFQWKLNQDSNIFIQENAFEIAICEMTAILFWVRWVKGPVYVIMSSYHVSPNWHTEMSYGCCQWSWWPTNIQLYVNEYNY